MKVVYVLSSDNTDFYYEQLITSIYSLKLHNPDVECHVLCDQTTYDTLTEARETIKSKATVTVVDVPQTLSKMQKSRFIKTSLRNLIDGDYLFLDTDTVVYGDVTTITNVDCEMAAALDRCTIGIVSPVVKQNRKELGWNNEDMVPDFNTGVLYVKDTENTRALYAKWHNLWNIGLEAKQWAKDQMAFVEAINGTDELVKEIGDEWNYQISQHINASLDNAVVVHYYGFTKNLSYPNKFDFNNIKSTGEVTDKTITAIDELKTKQAKPSNINLHELFDMRACKERIAKSKGVDLASLINRLQQNLHI